MEQCPHYLYIFRNILFFVSKSFKFHILLCHFYKQINITFFSLLNSLLFLMLNNIFYQNLYKFSDASYAKNLIGYIKENKEHGFSGILQQ